MELLERQVPLERARQAASAVVGGTGQVLLVSGEAGIGKSSFVRHVVDDTGDRIRFVEGSCDDLATPRPWGPFHDIATEMDDRLAEVLQRDSDLNATLAALLDDVRSVGRPVGLVVEDIHWADSASLDLLTSLVRRAADLPVLLILTYRPLDRGHRAISLVGSAPPAITGRIELQPLSAEAVGILAADDQLADDVYSSTGGNPFLVAELLGSLDEGVPTTVADAVLARVASLAPATRELLDLLSVVTAHVDVDLLDRFEPDWVEAVDEAEQRRIVEVDVDSGVRFRHDLVRAAIEGSLSARARRRHHGRVLTTLVDRGGPLAQIVHHARGAGAADTIAAYAPRAAREAAAAAAHREAIEHYRLALAHASSFSVVEQADLHDELAHELWFDGQPSAALDHALEAIALFERHGDDLRVGRALRSAANLCGWAGDAARATELRRRALDVLETLGPSAELAMLYGDLAVERSFACDIERAIDYGERSIVVAEASADRAALAIALGSTAFPQHWAHGRSDLWTRAIEVAGLDDLESATVARCNRAFVSIERMEYDAAEPALDDALRFTADHEAAAAHAITRVYRARVLMETGRWAEADEVLDAVRSSPDVDEFGPYFQSEHDYVAGRLAARRGDARARTTLDAAWRAVRPFDQLARLLQLAAALAELAVLDGGHGDELERLAECDAVLDHPDWPWAAEIAFWSWRLGNDHRPVPDLDHPRYHSMRGDWAAAAASWEQLGRPYERAEALVTIEDVESQIEGLALLDQLGAAPLAARTRQQLRDAGVRAVPRGPHRSTRRNPAGLTARQLDVLVLLSDGLTNAEIAAALYVSVRTVDSHVGTILQKLGVATRREAARRARELDIR